MFGLILIIIAAVLVVVDLVGHERTHAYRRWFTPVAVLLVCVALLVGIDSGIEFSRKSD